MIKRLFVRPQKKKVTGRKNNCADVCLHCRGSGFEPRMVGVSCRVCGGTGKGNNE